MITLFSSRYGRKVRLATDVDKADGDPAVVSVLRSHRRFRRKMRFNTQIAWKQMWTLTIDPEHMPEARGRAGKIIRAFLSKLRTHIKRAYDLKMEYAWKAELGKTHKRFHFHILFDIELSEMNDILPYWRFGFVKLSRSKSQRAFIKKWRATLGRLGQSSRNSSDEAIISIAESKGVKLPHNEWEDNAQVINYMIKYLSDDSKEDGSDHTTIREFLSLPKPVKVRRPKLHYPYGPWTKARADELFKAESDAEEVRCYNLTAFSMFVRKEDNTIKETYERKGDTEKFQDNFPTLSSYEDGWETREKVRSTARCYGTSRGVRVDLVPEIFSCIIPKNAKPLTFKYSMRELQGNIPELIRYEMYPFVRIYSDIFNIIKNIKDPTPDRIERALQEIRRLSPEYEAQIDFIMDQTELYEDLEPKKGKKDTFIYKKGDPELDRFGSIYPEEPESEHEKETFIYDIDSDLFW